MQTFAALADPTRRHIVELLAERDHTAGELVQHFDMTAPAISQHLKILREAQLVKVRAAGQRRIHSLDATGIRELELWLQHTTRFWNRQIDALERALLEDDTPHPADLKPTPKL